MTQKIVLDQTESLILLISKGWGREGLEKVEGEGPTDYMLRAVAPEYGVEKMRRGDLAELVIELACKVLPPHKLQAIMLDCGEWRGPLRRELLERTVGELSVMPHVGAQLQFDLALVEEGCARRFPGLTAQPEEERYYYPAN